MAPIGTIDVHYLDIIYYKTASTFDVVEYLGAGGRQLNTPYEMHAVPPRAYRAAEGGERACNIHRWQNAECY